MNEKVSGKIWEKVIWMTPSVIKSELGFKLKKSDNIADCKI